MKRKSANVRAELSLVLDTRRAKRGTLYPVKLRVYYQGKPVLHPTVFNLTKADYEKLDAKRTGDQLLKIRTQLQEILQAARSAADAITPFHFHKFFAQFIYDHPFFVKKTKKLQQMMDTNKADAAPKEWLDAFPILNEKPAYPDALSGVYTKIIRSLLRQRRASTAMPYQDSYRSFKSFRGDVRMSEVTKDYLNEYEAWMTRGRGRSFTTVGMYARALRAVYNEATDLKLVCRESYPFGRKKYQIPTGRNIKKSIDRQAIGEFYRATVDKKAQERARDFWFFIYYGNGMNIKDCIQLKYKNIQGDYLVFERAKTILTSRGKEPVLISALITEDMWRVIRTHGNPDTHSDNYIFPVLKAGMSAMEEFNAKKNFIKWVNKHAARVAKKAKIDRRPKSGDARHCIATHLKNAGAQMAYIKETLGHTNVKTTENYLGSYEDAQRKEFAKMLEGFKVHDDRCRKR